MYKLFIILKALFIVLFTIVSYSYVSIPLLYGNISIRAGSLLFLAICRLYEATYFFTLLTVSSEVIMSLDQANSFRWQNT